jgi:general secretion pathway protein J
VTAMRRARRQTDAGVTLIEMMVALALFALIGSAGFAMLDQVLRTQRGTEGRLEQLSARQRALHVIQSDFMMALPRSFRAEETGVSLDRSTATGGVHLTYHLADGVLHRNLADEDGKALSNQALLPDIEAVNWRFLTGGGVWSEVWPVDPVQTLATPRNPRAVELVLELQDRAGSLRRVALLPADLQ